MIWPARRPGSTATPTTTWPRQSLSQLSTDQPRSEAPMTTLQTWIASACAELGLEQSVVDERVVLNLARDVAHRVDRPAAPVTAFLLGVAVGAGEGLEPTADRLLALASRWRP